MLTPFEYDALRARADRANAYWEQHARGRRDASGKLVSASSMDAATSDAAPADARITNEERSALEVFEFMRDRPQRYSAYWRNHEPRVMCGGPVITTWAGDTLATVTRIGPAYTVYGLHGVASTRVSFRAQGINGVMYAGTYYKSSGDYVRMRAIKG